MLGPSRTEFPRGVCGTCVLHVGTHVSTHVHTHVYTHTGEIAGQSGAFKDVWLQLAIMTLRVTSAYGPAGH